MSHSLWVRGLKSNLRTVSYSHFAKSHSLWVRGLKFPALNEASNALASRTPCECVDWNIATAGRIVRTQVVALLVSAWIEMSFASSISSIYIRRTPCECVDWNRLYQQAFYLIALRRTPCECVDWNKPDTWEKSNPLSRTPCECVDWNKIIDCQVNSRKVALLVSAWIEILTIFSASSTDLVALLVMHLWVYWLASSTQVWSTN